MRGPSVVSFSAEDAFLLSSDAPGQISIDKPVTFNLPRLVLDSDSDLSQANYYDTSSESRQVDENRIIVVEVFENLGALESEVVIGALFGRVSLPVAQLWEGSLHMYSCCRGLLWEL